MKSRILGIALLSLVSVSARAMPASTESLLKGLASSGKLVEALEGEQNILKLEISRATDIRSDANMSELCGQDLLSRSASVLTVEIAYQPQRGADGEILTKSKKKYFVTRESADDLKLCQN